MTISVIIPAYKAEATIHRALASVLKQTLQPLEVIIVDDGSPVALTNLEEQYGQQVKLYRKANGGAASARNFGIEHSSGELIAFLDADDYWEPEKLERQLALHKKFPEVGFSFGAFWEQESPIEENLGKSPPSRSKLYPGDKAFHLVGSEAFQAATNAWTGTVMIARSLLGSARFLEHLRTAEDCELWFRLIKRGPIAYLELPLATLVLEPGSLSRTQHSADYENFLSVINAHSAELGVNATRSTKARTYRAWAGTLLNEGHFYDAFKPALMRLLYEPLRMEGYYIFCLVAVRSIRNFIQL
jgi:glycosyltransferase involved in cell wall biosynthesis